MDSGKKLRALLMEPLDLDRLMPNLLDPYKSTPRHPVEMEDAPSYMPHFNALPMTTQRNLVESQNTGRRYKPINPWKYPGLAASGVHVDPKMQKVCPVCFTVLRRFLLKMTGGVCPKCACRLQF